jgi:hypothetical protein
VRKQFKPAAELIQISRMSIWLSIDHYRTSLTSERCNLAIFEFLILSPVLMAGIGKSGIDPGAL